MPLRLAVGIAPLGEHQVPGQVEQDGRLPLILEAFQRQVDGLANDARILGDRGTDKIWRQDQHLQ